MSRADEARRLGFKLNLGPLSISTTMFIRHLLPHVLPAIVKGDVVETRVTHAGGGGDPKDCAVEFALKFDRMLVYSYVTAVESLFVRLQ